MSSWTGKSPKSALLDDEPAAQDWDDEESVLGAGITMKFALPQRMGGRTRWLIVGAGVAILVVSAAITLVLNRLVGLSALAQYGPMDLLAAIVIPVIPALGINLLVNFMDRFEREPWFLRLAAFLWGAIIAIPIALFVEHKFDTALLKFLGPNASDVLRSVFQGLNAGITEETIKGAGLLLLFFILRDEFDNVTDGIVYGALIGAGFRDGREFPLFRQRFSTISCLSDRLSHRAGLAGTFDFYRVFWCRAGLYSPHKGTLAANRYSLAGFFSRDGAA